MLRRKQIPLKLKSLLQKEINSECPFCNSEEVDHFEIHHIDNNRSNSVFENLLMLCSMCHSKITKGDIVTKDVVSCKNKLIKNMNKKVKPSDNMIKVKGNISNSTIANTITADKLILKGKTKPKVIPHPDSIEANLQMKNYVKHLIDRYQEFIKDDEYKGPKRFTQIWGAVKKEFGIDTYKVPQNKFEDLVIFLQMRISNTRIGRVNKSKGLKLFSNYKEYIEKYH